jgi:hypothetical protein
LLKDVCLIFYPDERFNTKDDNGIVRWFSSPPLNIAESKPLHTLDYLYYRAITVDEPQKAKPKLAPMDVDEEISVPTQKVEPSESALASALEGIYKLN